MDISFHPNFKKEAQDLKNFLKKEEFLDDINYVIGGDGTLLIYASKDKPNLLISPESSVGYYAFARIGNHYKAIRNYLSNTEKFNKEYLTIDAKINGKKNPDSALNEILITEGLHLASKMKSSLDNFMDLEINSGVMAYTSHGWSGFAKNLGAKKILEKELGLASIAKSKGIIPSKGLIMPEDFSIKLVPRNRETKFLLYIDCKDISPFNSLCSSKNYLRTKPYVLMPGDEISLTKGKPIIIASKL